MQYRIRNTGDVKTEAEFRAAYPNTSIPRPITDQIANGLGADVVVEAERPATTEFATFAAGPVEQIEGVWTQTWVSTPVGIAAARDVLKAQNLAKRLSLQAAGIAYTFPDGAGTVQTRNDTDVGNINAVATAGVALAGQGVTDPVLKFRDTENVTHPLTPSQAVAFGLAISDAISGLYETKWTIDGQIDALTTVAECEAFDVDAEWAA